MAGDKADSKNDKGKQGEGDDSQTMHVKVHGPYKIYYDGPADSISAVNLTGPFDVLPEHHNFITILTACEIIVRLGDKEEKIPIERGVMHVKADEVITFLDV